MKQLKGKTRSENFPVLISSKSHGQRRINSHWLDPGCLPKNSPVMISCPRWLIILERSIFLSILLKTFRQLMSEKRALAQTRATLQGILIFLTISSLQANSTDQIIFLISLATRLCWKKCMVENVSYRMHLCSPRFRWLCRQQRSEETSASCRKDVHQFQRTAFLTRCCLSASLLWNESVAGDLRTDFWVSRPQ